MTYTYLVTSRRGVSIFDALRETLAFCADCGQRWIAVTRSSENAIEVVAEGA